MQRRANGQVWRNPRLFRKSGASYPSGAKAPVGPAMRAGSSSDVFPELGSEGSGAYCEEDQGVAAAVAASTGSSSSYPAMASNKQEVAYAKVDKY